MPNNTDFTRQVQLLSDTVLYPDAVEFWKDQLPPDNNQLTGLQYYSQDINQLQSYVRHQKGRDWGKKEHYKNFYVKLDKTIDGLKKKAKQEFNLIPTGLTAAQEKKISDPIYSALVREFVQHLVAHGQYMLEQQRR
ncbi:hypothetical protein SCFA_4010003 [anaerobic digester metagenome]|uniref:Uncharacterized protein n=1 Tax=anaerobic digester metagenome TaxID=1263854 RepID=A0A485M689_9ZZZZ